MFWGMGPSGFVNMACPWLPEVKDVLGPAVTRRHGARRDHVFYQDALSYAQSQWQSGKPAQALLQLDKAWMWVPGRHGENPMGDPGSDPGDGRKLVCELSGVADPYRALVWILRQAWRGDRGFLGNPVRHFQHLASRMSGPGAELRAWRAWACMHLAERALPGAGFPRDGGQICREGLWIPAWSATLAALARLGWPDESTWAQTAATLTKGNFLDSA